MFSVGHMRLSSTDVRWSLCRRRPWHFIVVTHNVMQISGGGKVLELKPSSLWPVLSSAVDSGLAVAGYVSFCYPLDSFRLLVQHVCVP